MGIKGFFNRLFQGKSKSNQHTGQAVKEKKKENRVLNFFKRLFGGKK
jgi:hypothetical protein